MKLFAMVIVLSVLAGCANPNLVGMRGDKLNTNYSLQDRRAAKSHIKVTQAVPADSEKVGAGPFTVERCHQYGQDAPPSDAVLLDDLVLLAYGEGADGLADVQYERESGLMRNCWHVAKASAVFYRNTKQVKAGK